MKKLISFLLQLSLQYLLEWLLLLILKQVKVRT